MMEEMRSVYTCRMIIYLYAVGFHFQSIRHDRINKIDETLKEFKLAKSAILMNHHTSHRKLCCFLVPLLSARINFQIYIENISESKIFSTLP